MPTAYARRSSWRLLIVALLAMLALAVACGDDGATDSAASMATAVGPDTAASVDTFPLSLRDSGGAEVRIERRPQRVVSLSAGHTEGLFAIGAGAQLVARDRFSNFPAEAEALPAVEYSNPDPETVLAHRPDLVIMSTRQRTQVTQFRSMGMNVFYAAEPASLEEVYTRLGELGTLTGHKREAEQVVARMRSEIGAITNALSTVERGPRVFYELSAELYTAAPNTFIGSLLTLLKVTNIAEGSASAFPQLTAEAVIAANPEVVLLTDAQFGVTYESVARRPGWAGVSAVANRRVHAIDPDLVNRPGPRLVQGMRELARALYPELMAGR